MTLPGTDRNTVNSSTSMTRTETEHLVALPMTIRHASKRPTSTTHAQAASTVVRRSKATKTGRNRRRTITSTTTSTRTPGLSGMRTCSVIAEVTSTRLAHSSTSTTRRPTRTSVPTARPTSRNRPRMAASLCCQPTPSWV